MKFTVNFTDSRDPTCKGLAYHHYISDESRAKPTLLWLNGFMSDMGGTKIATLREAAVKYNWNLLCFDYYATGRSQGDWSQARIGLWRRNVRFVVDELIKGPVVVIGSSLGGWLGLLSLLDRPERIQSIGLIAPAPDFTSELMLPSLDPELRKALTQTGSFTLSNYDYAVDMYQDFFDEAEHHKVLNQIIKYKGRVEIIHGLKDESVPYHYGLGLKDLISSDQMQIHLIKDGDHRLSRPQDLALIIQSVKSLMAQ